MPRVAAGKKVQYRALQRAEAADLAAAVAETREELKRRFRWAEKPVDPDSEAAFIEARPSAVAIVEAKTGELAGVGEILEDPRAPGLGELSFWIRGSKQNAGLGTDAARNLCGRAFKNRVHKVWARVDMNNRAGRRVLKKLGFKFEGCLRREKRLNGRWADMECWAMMKEDWK